MLGFDLDNAVSLQRFETDFEDLGKIGSGGFSVVSKVRNKRDGMIYAIKIVKIKPSELKHNVMDYFQKVMSQARVLSNLSHPNILQYHGCWMGADLKSGGDSQDQQNEIYQEKQQQLELVMQEYSQNSYGIQFEKASSRSQQKKQRNKKQVMVTHENSNDNIFGTNLQKYKEIRVYFLCELGESSLQKYVHKRNQVQRKTVDQLNKIKIENYKFILDIIEGLTYIHGQKIIHRDIKLQNIIINRDKRCKIIDFGLAKKVRNLKSLTIDKFQHQVINSDDSQRHSSSVGTRIFSSPEQSNSENYDYRTDIYSFAMVIGILFSQYTTSHEEGQLLLNLRNKKLQKFDIDERLKNLMFRSLSEQNKRPELKQIKDCVKRLLRQAREKENQGIQQLKRPENENQGRQIVGKSQSTGSIK